MVQEIVASVDVSPAGQQVASAGLADRLDDIVSADVIVVDALARIACAPWIERWQMARPLVTLVHELPSVASGDTASADEQEAEARILAADALISHGGFDFEQFGEVSQVVRDYHDPILKESAYLVGGGASYQVSDDLTASIYGRAFLSGVNTSNANLVGIGLEWMTSL